MRTTDPDWRVHRARELAEQASYFATMSYLCGAAAAAMAIASIAMVFLK